MSELIDRLDIIFEGVTSLNFSFESCCIAMYKLLQQVNSLPQDDQDKFKQIMKHRINNDDPIKRGYYEDVIKFAKMYL